MEEIIVVDALLHYGTVLRLCAIDGETGAVLYTQERATKLLRAYDCGGVYAIIDKDSGEVFSDNGETVVHKTIEEATDVVLAKWRAEVMERGKVNRRVVKWLDSHIAYKLILKSLVENNGADEEYITKFFRSNGIRVKFTAKDLLFVLRNEVDRIT